MQTFMPFHRILSNTASPHPSLSNSKGTWYQSKQPKRRSGILTAASEQSHHTHSPCHPQISSFKPLWPCRSNGIDSPQQLRWQSVQLTATSDPTHSSSLPSPFSNHLVSITSTILDINT
ncbi:uncharacterized protein LACBIDRAFT_309679 [Laccaria bicolor S238N-H82]|uniref:Predicted protein n=1 Tax=Laccaria bicolor (strain S238N-H82 / ATCC MYA-4686) TaxID=486041 RepID=B0DST7_LACBS|nr:uncharacterized protein LACBIDRAFT_309679 [Laccaria bicolor S238N-H82]EDR02296.1 predicted protein [Laccaria bicolor S238N-H82]|eukprot:XP_001886973.1 predicted protein [Laccaria bicolor S238N-H82]